MFLSGGAPTTALDALELDDGGWLCIITLEEILKDVFFFYAFVVLPQTVSPRHRPTLQRGFNCRSVISRTGGRADGRTDRGTNGRTKSAIRRETPKRASPESAASIT